MEKCDVVNEFGARTGRVVNRGTELGPGEFYLVVHIWIRDEHGNYIIQQRAPHLQSWPNVWATTVGYVLAGEESSSGAIREVKEELGIALPLAQMKRVAQLVWENRVEDIWMVEVSKNLIATPMLGSEVSNWKWISGVELEQMVSQGNFFNYSYMEEILKSQPFTG
jgi:isopentenyldiphosphate isomerase